MKAKDLLTILIVFLLVNYLFNFFAGPKTNEPQTVASDITIASVHQEYGQNDLVSVKITNRTASAATIKNECPAEPLEVLYFKDGKWLQKETSAAINCEGTADLLINPGEEKTVTYSSWNHSLFGELGKYKIRAAIQVQAVQIPAASSQQGSLASQEDGSQITTQSLTAEAPQTTETVTKYLETAEFEVKPQGWFGILWTSAFYQPMYNILIFIVSVVPFHDLGWAIIFLTIIIRTILLLPSQKALKSQRKMNELQPKLAKIKEKYKDNQEMIAKETMALWKEYKVNPFGSCLPLLIQFPVLIALFYVIQDGLNPNNAYLLYEPLKNFSLQTINVNFFGILDLTKINSIVLPLIVGGLQFLQMKLATITRKEPKKEDKKGSTEMEVAGKTMMYVMPVMIALFTASVPSGVGLYWSVSTIYGIVQQIVVNKQVDEEGVKVKVLPDKK